MGWGDTFLAPIWAIIAPLPRQIDSRGQVCDVWRELPGPREPADTSGEKASKFGCFPAENFARSLGKKQLAFLHPVNHDAVA